MRVYPATLPSTATRCTLHLIYYPTMPATIKCPTCLKDTEVKTVKNPKNGNMGRPYLLVRALGLFLGAR